MRRFFLVIIFLASASSAFSVNVDDFNSLQWAINTNQTPLNITVAQINWPANSPLTIDYSPTFTSPLSQVIFDGQNHSALFTVNQPTTWGTSGNGLFTFQNGLATSALSGTFSVTNTTVTFNNPTLFHHNLSIGSGGNTPGGLYSANSTVIFNDTANFTDNATSASGGAIYLIHPSSITFHKAALFDGNSAGSTTYGGGAIHAHANGCSSATFLGPVTFSHNIAPVGNGGAIFLSNSNTLSFHDKGTFISNSAGSNGGAIYQIPMAGFRGVGTLTFNDTATFIKNTAGSNGGGIYYTVGSLTFNDTATFTNNSAGSNGGAIYVGAPQVIPRTGNYTVGTLTFNDTATFINNSAGSNGGAIYVGNTAQVILRAVNPSAPTVFQGNTPQAIYFNGPGQLTLDTDADTMIDIQDSIASANSAPTITKQGWGTWKQSGDSTGYKGTTNVIGGILEFQPGAVYGTTDSGTFTLGVGGVLAFSNAPGNSLPVLQATHVTLDGITTVGMIEAGDGTVIRSGTPILSNGGFFSGGDILNEGQTLFYDWRFVFASPNEVNFSAVQTQTIKEVVEGSGVLGGSGEAGGAGGNENESAIADPLDAVDGGATEGGATPNPGPLTNYVQAIKNSSTPREVRQLVDPLHGQILTGGYGLLWNQMTNFTIQVDDHLNTSPCTAIKDNEYIQRTSVGKKQTLICGHPSPWVAWGQVMGGRGYQSSYKRNNGYESVNGGLIVGFDRFLDPNWRLGGAVTYQRGTLDWAKYNSETRGNTVGGIVYAAYSRDAWFGQSQLGGGGSRVKNNRNIPLSAIHYPTVTASSRTTLPFFLGRAEGGYHFDYKGFRLTPSLGLLYLHSQNSAYAEGGAGDFNLRVKGSNQNNLEAQGFFEVAYNALINERPVIFRVNYGLGYAALDKQTTLTTGFLAFPDLPTFTASSLNVGRWRQIGEVGMNVEVAQNVRLLFDYIGLFTPHQYNQMGAVGLKAVF